MTDESYKLKKFQDAVFAEVNAKAVQIKQEAEQYKEQELENNKTKLLEQSFILVENKTLEIKNKYKLEVAQHSLNAKRDILLKRNELTTKIIDNVKLKLKDFIKTTDYKDYLLKKIKSFSENEKLSDVTIFVMKDDMIFEQEIKTAYGLPCSIKINDEILFGGFIACDANCSVYFDETLEQKLLKQNSYVIENCKFEI